MPCADTYYRLVVVPRGESVTWDGNLDGLDGPCDLVSALQRDGQSLIECYRWHYDSMQAARHGREVRGGQSEHH